MNAAWIALATLCLVMAWRLLYLASERMRDALGEASPNPALYRGAGLLLATAALACCTTAQGPAMGGLLWVSLLCASAFAVVGVATWAPQLGRGQRQ